MRLRHNQQGFSPLIIILILLLLAIIGFAGWRIWSKDTPSSRADTKTASSSDKDGAGEAAEPAYAMPVSEAYRVALPATWVSATCADNSDILFLAPTTDKLGKCASESGGTVAVSKNSGDTSHNEEYYTSDDHYASVNYSPVTIDGITGSKVTYTIATENIIGYPPVGTQQIIYSLFDGTNTFSLSYTRFAGEPDLAAAVQTLAESFDKL
ncbi:MAG: hypothetical protein AAB462_03835 [Patescibacteria group bacterium]